MQTHREEHEEEIGRDGLEIRSVAIVEGGARETEFAKEFMEELRLESIATEEEKEEEKEFEFAFVCENPDGSLISAAEAFQDGRIKPFYPVFGGSVFLDEDVSQSRSSIVRGILVEDRAGSPSSSSSSLDGGDSLEGLAEGTYCLWRTGRGKTGEVMKGVCKKSNSTGFSKLWRVKELVMRSNSDGKDAFVFLNPKKAKENTSTTTTAAAQAKSSSLPSSSSTSTAKAVAVAVRKDGRNARSDKNRRRSYLPYKVGFIINTSGMSRNVHPY